MVIGGTGQIGGIVLKNLYSLKGLNIYSTIRNVTMTHDAHIKSESNTLIDYKERYDYINAMDVVISGQPPLYADRHEGEGAHDDG